MTKLNENDRDALLSLSQRLRAEEKAFRGSADLLALQERLDTDPPAKAAAEAAFRSIHDEIEQRAVKAKSLSFEVALEVAVVRDRFLLELHRTADLDAAREAARSRTDPASLLERARSEAAAGIEAPEAEDVAEPGM